MAISFKVTKNCTVDAAVADEDGFAVRTLARALTCTADSVYRLVWDGRDDAGAIVPDEVYYPLLTATASGDTDSFHPARVSGGTVVEATGDRYDAPAGAISYRLDQASRVLIRAGIAKGPLLRTVVDWAPRLAGQVTEMWDGRDQEGQARLDDISSNASLLIRAYALPQPVVITYGEGTTAYRDYRKAKDPELAKRFPESILRHGDLEQSAHFFQPRCQDYAPRIHVTLPEAPHTDPTGAHILEGRTLVRIEIDPADFRFIDEQYEITIFLDHDFYAEEELGYTPYNWLWALDAVSKGYHTLTVNVASYKDRIGVRSLRVFVK